MFEQLVDPVGRSLALRALVAASPLLTLFVLLGGLRTKAWPAGLISWPAARLLAIPALRMPVAHTVQVLDASIRGVPVEDLLDRALTGPGTALARPASGKE